MVTSASCRFEKCLFQQSARCFVLNMLSTCFLLPWLWPVLRCLGPGLSLSGGYLEPVFVNSGILFLGTLGCISGPRFGRANIGNYFWCYSSGNCWAHFCVIFSTSSLTISEKFLGNFWRHVRVIINGVKKWSRLRSLLGCLGILLGGLVFQKH